jgi:hypothetical protein
VSVSVKNLFFSSSFSYFFSHNFREVEKRYLTNEEGEKNIRARVKNYLRRKQNKKKKNQKKKEVSECEKENELVSGIR